MQNHAKIPIHKILNLILGYFDFAIMTLVNDNQYVLFFTREIIAFICDIRAKLIQNHV